MAALYVGRLRTSSGSRRHADAVFYSHLLMLLLFLHKPSFSDQASTSYGPDRDMSSPSHQTYHEYDVDCTHDGGTSDGISGESFAFNYAEFIAATRY